ncbi:sugar ABC transporter substrate-binding protein [Microbacterium sp. MEC084]|jgi:putative ABC transport system substrate-binding protein|uniref:ABC transporter substrate-binding protein n=1 Tax=unclassified Microbacterium TaxID=2609290 RepID=UPI0006FA517C|nr:MULTISPECIES: ABC transporter substrate-binding protein [unclassified Microbacterium]KQZ06578.1 sugar ABC transporter substrate-binding protein [Microbacterium sp. Root53]MCD1269798.1 sugar ABC transporter substrate-binding protein [Microbacterium sp. MEC084]
MNARIVPAALAALGLLTLTACGSGGGAPEGAPGALRIGISQIVQHPALDAAREGFKQALEDAGIEAVYDEQNAQGEQATATTIATTFATEGVDLVLAIATPTAQAAAQSIADIPVLFTAVTDPVEAGLVASFDAPGANLTGTSDMNPVAEQMDLIAEVLPDAERVGIVYSSGEVNSEIQVGLAKEAAEELGLEIAEATVTNSSEVGQAVASLGDVDAIYVPTDNRVVEGLEAVVQHAEANGIALFGSEMSQVERGAIATYGIDYTALGYQTGEMAVRVLTDGADPAEMPVETLAKYTLVINEAAAERQGVELPAAVVERADEIVE